MKTKKSSDKMLPPVGMEPGSLITSDSKSKNPNDDVMLTSHANSLPGDMMS